MDCPNCGTANPEQARFCLSCGTALAASSTQPAAREERKVVTAVFADLVGFTARAEQLDPEDVERILRPYHDHLRTDFERFGGTVEKFIGDAVMAVFGAPTAHEDDAERAVRAALAIRDWAREQDGVELRIGVNTGEALVSVDARPELGQSMVKGDVINTAARLQAAAPANGVLVGETTYHATKAAIDYRVAEAVVAKGKAEPVRVWEALAPHSRQGVDVRQTGGATLVGRATELDALLQGIARARSAREPQLVTLVGVPGIGKSRLTWEFFRGLDAEREVYTWRQGRSLPYGEGVSFWALGEMVKAEAGILETDDSAAAGMKLENSVAAVVADESQHGWVTDHLRPLLGLAVDEDHSADRRAEAFAAWRRYIEALAERNTLILTFEDLHWADDGLLDFIDYIAEWASAVPLLILGTARPELLARRPGWGGGKRNALTLSLAPLSDDETTALIHALLMRPLLAADVQQELIERAGGNPLYAEEFVRLVEEGRLEQNLPENVQAIIAARLDALPTAEKELIRQAAVLGKVFWLGGLAHVSGRSRWAVEEGLHKLERREFVRRERSSSVATETEYAFRHALMRDVAYEQLPRAERAERHRRAAEWTESLGRPDDTAEMLAYHYLAALEYARAAGRPVDAMVAPALVALSNAAERASALNSFASAGRFYAAALELTGLDDPRRPMLLFGSGRSQQAVGHADAVSTLEAASAALAAAGNRDKAAEAELLVADFYWHIGDRRQKDEHLGRAQELIDRGGPTPSRAIVLSELTRYSMIREDAPAAVEYGEQAIALARQLKMPSVEAHALDSVGTARFMAGDRAGLKQLEQALEIARAANSVEQGRSLNNLSVATWLGGDIQRSHELRLESARLEQGYGRTFAARFAEGFAIATSFFLGDWDEFVEAARRFHAAHSELGQQYQDYFIDGHIAQLMAARGQDDEALSLARRVAEWGRQMREGQALLPAMSALATVQLILGRDHDALETVRELSGLTTPNLIVFPLTPVAALARDPALAELLRGMLPDYEGDWPWLAALRAMVDDDRPRAAVILDGMGVKPVAAMARTEGAARLAAAGRHAEADALLRQALEFWRRVKANRFIGLCEGLLSKAG
jgi:class 3 adenylate cyclase